MPVQEPLQRGEDYAAMDAEMASLQAAIRRAARGEVQGAQDILSMRAHSVSLVMDEEGAQGDDSVPVVTLQVSVSYAGNDVLENVNVHFDAQPPFVVAEPLRVVPRLGETCGPRGVPCVRALTRWRARCS